MICGIDDGSAHVGIAIVQKCKTYNKVVFKGTIEQRQDVKKLMEMRLGYNITINYHKYRKHIVRYTVDKKDLNVTQEKINECLKQVKLDACEQIKIIKTSKKVSGYKKGLKMAFWLNQYANASFIIDEQSKINERIEVI